MSNNHRWVRIPSLSVLSQLLAEKAVIVEVCPIHNHHNFKAQDAESFKDIVFYTQTEVRLIDPASFINYEKVSTITYNSILGFKDSPEGIVIPADVHTHNYSNSQLLNQLRFDLSTTYGFYLLQKSLGGGFKNIIDSSSIPEDGFVLSRYHHLKRKVFEYPEGFYHLFTESGENTSCLSLKELSDLYIVQVEPTWEAFSLNLDTDEGFAEAIQHIEQTFVSNSGITPDEYFDEINKDHLQENENA